MNFFDINFFQNLITTFISVLLGLLTGIHINKLSIKYKIEKDKPQFIDALTKSLKKNYEICDFIIKELTGTNSIPIYKFDIGFLNSISLTKYNYISIDKCKKIDDIIDSFKIINYKLNLITENEIIFASHVRRLYLPNDFKQVLIKSTSDLKEEINNILKLIKG